MLKRPPIGTPLTVCLNTFLTCKYISTIVENGYNLREARVNIKKRQFFPHILGFIKNIALKFQFKRYCKCCLNNTTLFMRE